MQNRYLTCTALLSVLIASCGNSSQSSKFDISSIEAFRGSIGQAYEGLPKNERETFSRDMNTIYQAVTASGLVDAKHLYSNDYAWISQPAGDPIIDSKFTVFLQRGRRVFEGTSLNDVSDMAQDIRVKWYQNTGRGFHDGQKNVQKEFNSYPTMILKLDEHHKRINARVALAKAKQGEALINYQISHLEVNRRLDLIIKGEFTLQNTLETEIDKAQILHRIDIPGIEGHFANLDMGLPMDTNPMAPGETRTFPIDVNSTALTSIRRRKSAKSIPFEQMVGEYKPVSSSPLLKGYFNNWKTTSAQFFPIGPELKDVDFLENYEARLNECVANQNALKTYYDDRAQFIELMKELRDDPRPMDIQYPVNGVKVGSHGYKCYTKAPS